MCSIQVWTVFTKSLFILPIWVQIHHLLVLWLLVAIPWIVPSQSARGSRAQRRSHPGQRCQSSESDLVVSALQPSAPGSYRSGYRPRCCKTVLLAWLQEVSRLHKTTVNRNYHEPRVCTCSVLHGMPATVTRPKSPTFKFPSPSREKKMLEGFRSRWTSPFSWI